jgi:Xaa-Pro aminopeptidase
MSSAIYDMRLARVRAEMRERGVECLILTPGANMRYLAGFSEEGHERLLALVAPIEGECAFVAPALNAAQARANAAGIEAVYAWDDATGWETALRQAFAVYGIEGGAIGLDDTMPARFVLRLEELYLDARFRLASRILDPLRAVKDSAEIDAMLRAAVATDTLIHVAIDACREGETEMDVAVTLQRAVARSGHAASFETIVGTGANGASPHHRTGATRIQRGDVIVLDFGVQVDGYCGDITRTVAVGRASDEARRVYEIVYRAHCAGVAAVRPGATAADVDRAARSVIEEAGFGQYFIHRTGHGIGLECHEAPNIVAGNDTLLQPGHCFSVEPGVYLPGQFGVRLENIVAVAEDGTARVLNTAIPSELPVI